jgi:hypothetical protein
LGPDYQADQLETILVEPLLTQWRRRADAAAQESWYWEYDHNVEVESVTPDDPTADALQAVVLVTEQAKLFEFGEENVPVQPTTIPYGCSTTWFARMAIGIFRE